MSKSKTTWIHMYDIAFSWFIFRADFNTTDGVHYTVRASIKIEDLPKRGRLAVRLRQMQMAINKKFGD